MDFSTITAIGGLVVAVAGVSVAVFAMEPARRSEWVSFSKKWLTIVFVFAMVANSILGIYLFVKGPPQLVRSDIFTLALHLFNLLSVPLIGFFEAMSKAMDAREAKRVELVEEVGKLRERVDGLVAVIKRRVLDIEEP